MQGRCSLAPKRKLGVTWLNKDMFIITQYQVDNQDVRPKQFLLQLHTYIYPIEIIVNTSNLSNLNIFAYNAFHFSVDDVYVRRDLYEGKYY